MVNVPCSDNLFFRLIQPFYAAKGSKRGNYLETTARTTASLAQQRFLKPERWSDNLLKEGLPELNRVTDSSRAL
jgi:hypothetical protein